MYLLNVPIGYVLGVLFRGELHGTLGYTIFLFVLLIWNIVYSVITVRMMLKYDKENLKWRSYKEK